MIRKRTDLTNREQRWFRVKGYANMGRGAKPKSETKDFELSVTITGSFYDLMQEVSGILMQEHDFYPVHFIAHSKKQETL